MFNSPFDSASRRTTVDEEADIIFVADYFAEDYAGGAELTTEALITAATDAKVQKIRASELAMNHLSAGVSKHWVFCNITSMKPDLIPSIIGNLSYSIIEYDYKFCMYRSIEKHQAETGTECDCDSQLHGKMISALFHGAQSIWWMSEQQERRYLKRFPFLEKNQRIVLSSVFDDKFFAYANLVNGEKYEAPERKGWIVLGSESWIKGANDAEQYCKDNNLEYEVVWGIPYNEMLIKLSTAKGFVYLPKGGDTCPRMVIEAKVLGCEVVLNENVQHKDEEWFTGPSIDMLSYLYAARERFWRAIKNIASYTPTLSGYTTVRNAERMEYPWFACIDSMLAFCHEVIVVDGGSDDGTWEDLQELAQIHDKLKVSQVIVDENNPSFAYESDGKLKATARSLCTGDFCWQMDADEVVHENDYEKVHQLLRAFPVHCDIVSLPVIEYWGSENKVRMDVNPWKWRLSRNLDHITQGIPADLRKYDEDGNLYAGMGTDSCDYIDVKTGERLRHIGFYNEQAHQMRTAGLMGDDDSRQVYEDWFNRAVESLPGVHHYSWLNIPRKIKQYKLHWGKFWKSMYRHDVEDTAESNVMFNKPWSDVTDDDMVEMGERLATELGGWIFHTKVNFSQKVPHISVNRGHPSTFIAMIKDDQEE